MMMNERGAETVQDVLESCMACLAVYDTTPIIDFMR